VEPDELRRYHETAGTFRAADTVPGLPGGVAGPGAGPGSELGAGPGSELGAGPGSELGAGPLVPDALGFLHGRWRLERRLVDRVTGCSGTFAGTAQFAPLGGTAGAGAGGNGLAALTYHEHGELRFRGHRGPASRSLIFRGRPDGTADVCFADGREFYRLDPRSGTWRGEHQCGADHYAVAGQVLGSGKFQERWLVRGPAKDYYIITTLVRA